MRVPITVTDVSRVMQRVRGLRIISGEETDEGFHLNLEGGQTFIVTGQMVIAIYSDQEGSVH
jgi:hypothetical protein